MIVPLRLPRIALPLRFTVPASVVSGENGAGREGGTPPGRRASIDA